MHNPKNQDLSDITVKVQAVHEHHWVSGQKLHHIPVKHPSAALLHQLWLIQEGFVEFEADGKNCRIEQGAKMTRGFDIMPTIDRTFFPAKNT